MGGTKYSEPDVEVKAGGDYDGAGWLQAYEAEADPDKRQQLLSQREDALRALLPVRDVTAQLAWVASERARLLAR